MSSGEWEVQDVACRPLVARYLDTQVPWHVPGPLYCTLAPVRRLRLDQRTDGRNGCGPPD